MVSVIDSAYIYVHATRFVGATPVGEHQPGL